jgi:protein-S-isoprenylcysteine O-methyltransferase Ste14
MSLSRTVLVCLQAFCNQLAFTPPNPPLVEGRYHTEQLYILQIAPLIFKLIHQVLLWVCAFFEVVFYVNSTLSYPIPSSSICLTSQPNIHLTPLFTIGVLAVALGTYIRLDCFQALGHLFTFDLTIYSDHKLVTDRFYAYVRHPAYTGSILLVAGLSFSHLTGGSWLTECGPLTASGSALVVWATWWSWTLSVGFSRADAEDKQMKKLFNAEWECWAANVPWWFFPGLI